MDTAPSPEIGLLGTGTCRLSGARTTSSAYCRIGAKLLLIDCGMTVPRRIGELRLLEGCEEVSVHLSHRHVDHVMGLFSLLQGLTWSDDAAEIAVTKVTIHCTPEVEQFVQAIYRCIGDAELDLSGVNPERGRRIEFNVGEDHADWDYDFAGVRVHSVHLPQVNNHGVRFVLNATTYGFTCDATEVTAELRQFLGRVDVAAFDFGHLCNRLDADGTWHYDPRPVEALLTDLGNKELIALHPYLRDLQHEKMDEAARDAVLEQRLAAIREAAAAGGFSGSLRLGHDGMRLL